uniref:Peptidoglycan recognition protein family domain-containing protein n=1 Tax=Graphocephala atropunctata TaxID=36148 RepID=A0A1B6KL95_9HEMI
MSSFSENLSSQAITFKQLKSDHSDKHDGEVLIPTDSLSEHCSKVEGEKLYFKFCTIIVSGIFISIFTILTICFFYSTASYIDSFTDSSQNPTSFSNTNASQTQFQEASNSSCIPLESANKVIITLSKAHNYSCSDNVTCTSLLQKIELQQNGLRYNFVIGSDSELYLGLGFKCRVNSTENAIHIKVLRNDITKRNSLSEDRRISEILEQGLMCGTISKTYTISTLCEEIPLYMLCKHAFEHNGIIKYTTNGKRDTFHNPAHAIGTLLHKDLKWIACGEPPKEQNIEVTKSKVITVKSLSKHKCQPYQPVDHISVDIVETSSVNCSDDASCDAMVQRIEKHHDGSQYNFIIGTHFDIYVGLGFRCSAHGVNTTLKIKVLRLKQYAAFEELARIAEIIQQGIACGKILGKYSISKSCHTDDNSHSIYDWNLDCFSLVDLFLGENSQSVDHYAETGRVEHYSYQENEGRKIIRQHFKWMACHKSEHVTTQPVNPTTIQSESDFVKETYDENYILYSDYEDTYSDY